MRGRLGSLPTFFLTIGVLYSYITGGGLHWRTSAYAGFAPAVTLFLGMLLVPESPYWMLLKGRYNEARDILIKIRGSQ